MLHDENGYDIRGFSGFLNDTKGYDENKSNWDRMLLILLFCREFTEVEKIQGESDENIDGLNNVCDSWSVMRV